MELREVYTRGLIINVLVETVKTFIREVASPKDAELFANLTLDDVDGLKKAVNLISAQHLNLDANVIESGETITYLDVYEEDDFSIGIFVMPPNSRIPLHDHPRMCVVSRLLCGSLCKTSYDWQTQALPRTPLLPSTRPGRPARHIGGPLSLCAPSTFVLSSRCENLHEFVAGPQGAVVLDVLLPPYDPNQDRDCTYYKVCPLGPKRKSWAGAVHPHSHQTRRGHKGSKRTLRKTFSQPGLNLVWLEPTPPPENFAVMPGPYPGPRYDEGFMLDPENQKSISKLIEMMNFFSKRQLAQSESDAGSSKGDDTAEIMMDLHDYVNNAGCLGSMSSHFDTMEADKIPVSAPSFDQFSTPRDNNFDSEQRRLIQKLSWNFAHSYTAGTLFFEQKYARPQLPISDDVGVRSNHKCSKMQLENFEEPYQNKNELEENYMAGKHADIHSHVSHPPLIPSLSRPRVRSGPLISRSYSTPQNRLLPRKGQCSVINEVRKGSFKRKSEFCMSLKANKSAAVSPAPSFDFHKLRLSEHQIGNSPGPRFSPGRERIGSDDSSCGAEEEEVRQILVEDAKDDVFDF